MILDKLENSSLYRGMNPRIAAAFDFLKSADLDALPAGKNPINGDELFAMAADYTGNTRDKGVWEAHRKYIDVQYIVKGVEVMGFANLKNLTVTKEYDAKDDYLLAQGEGDYVTVPAGWFAIFHPQDAHMPNLVAPQPVPVRKIVVKVQI